MWVSYLPVSRSNAWVAILNEMFNARRGTSLVSMGVLSFAYRRNAQVATAFQGDPYNLSSQDAIALLELRHRTRYSPGAVDAGKEYTLTAAEREYIFFTPSAKKLVLLRYRRLRKAKLDLRVAWSESVPTGIIIPTVDSCG
ncbi:MAG: hypothetical protein ACLU9R_07485 [Faecalibacterium sp.]